MTTPNTSNAVKAIESIYGRYEQKDPKTDQIIEATKQKRVDVGRMLVRRYRDDQGCLDKVLDAIKEYQEIRYGPPDAAQVGKAIVAYEEQYGTKIAPVPRTFEAPTEKEIEETRIDCKRLAEERGIDTTKDTWAAQYFFAVMAEQKAKEDGK